VIYLSFYLFWQDCVLHYRGNFLRNKKFLGTYTPLREGEMLKFHIILTWETTAKPDQPSRSLLEEYPCKTRNNLLALVYFASAFCILDVFYYSFFTLTTETIRLFCLLPVVIPRSWISDDWHHAAVPLVQAGKGYEKWDLATFECNRNVNLKNWGELDISRYGFSGKAGKLHLQSKIGSFLCVIIVIYISNCGVPAAVLAPETTNFLVVIFFILYFFNSDSDLFL
jgi:hypothetical protein